MDLYLVRHGLAELRGAKPDGKRSLTAEGVKMTTEIAQGLKRLDCLPSIIASSPLRRAAETAGIMRDVLCPHVTVDILQSLGPGASAAGLIGWLTGLEEQTVMAVGHNPDMPTMASELIAGNADIKIAFKKAAVCLVSFDGRPEAGEGTLRWLLQPHQLRLIGAS